jgi:hypothetical protein
VKEKLQGKKGKKGTYCHKTRHQRQRFALGTPYLEFNSSLRHVLGGSSISSLFVNYRTHSDSSTTSYHDVPLSTACWTLHTHLCCKLPTWRTLEEDCGVLGCELTQPPGIAPHLGRCRRMGGHHSATLRARSRVGDASFYPSLSAKKASTAEWYAGLLQATNRHVS